MTSEGRAGFSERIFSSVRMRRPPIDQIVLPAELPSNLGERGAHRAGVFLAAKTRERLI